MAQTYMRNGVWQGFSAADVARDYEDYKGARTQNAFNAMKFDEAQRAIQGRNALQDYMRQNPNATEEDVVNQGVSVGAVEPVAGMEARVNIAAARARAAEAAAKMTAQQRKGQRELLQMMLPTASLVKDQAGYDSWKASLPEAIAAIMPPQYDPAFMEKNIIDGMAFMDVDKRMRLQQGQERNDIARARLDKPPKPGAPVRAVNPETGEVEWVSPENAVGKKAPPTSSRRTLQNEVDELVSTGTPLEVAQAIAGKRVKTAEDEDGNAVFADIGTGKILGRIDKATNTWIPGPGNAAPVAPPVSQRTRKWAGKTKIVQ